ncbi:MAG TPA: hypothetical protein VNZ57_02220, partial [Longimicrobiales bacterium]|nr:hypothetical protein [Longimicrobiales bacterium]
MALAVIGLSHRTAPVEVRERFVFNDSEAAAGLLQLTGSGGIREAVLLSTCNRTELYLVGDRSGGENGGSGNGSAATNRAWAAVEDPMFQAAERMLAERAGMPVSEAASHMYRIRRLEAARHLFRVVTSLDSMVVGEAQIQGQVRRAYESAAALGGDRRVVGPVLSRLFESALRVGGRVRSETAL